MYVNAHLDESGDFVKIEMKTDQARRLFHDLNRLLSLVDLHAPDLGSRPNSSAGGDEASYTRLNVLCNKLARAIDIGQEEP